MKKACKTCRRITEEGVCPVCNSHDLSAKWKGLAIIINPQKSEIAKRLEITVKGKYALVVQ